MDSCAISFLTLYTLDVDDLFLSVHLDSLADLLTLIVSSNHLDLIIRVDGHGAEVLPHSLLESGDDRIFLHTCKGALKWHLGFLLLSEITKGLNFLVTIYLAPGRLRPVCTGPEVQIIFQNNHVLYIPTNNEWIYQFSTSLQTLNVICLFLILAIFVGTKHQKLLNIKVKKIG